MTDLAAALQPRRLAAVALIVSALCGSTAAIVLIGWVFGAAGLTNFGRDWTPMVASTSLCVLSAAMALALVARRADAGGVRMFHVLLGTVITAIAAVTLADFASTWLRGVPLYAPVPAWRMAPTTALAMLLMGLAIASWGPAGRRALAREVLLVSALIIPAHTLVAFLLGATPKSDLMGQVNMSPITAVNLAALAAMLLTLSPGARAAGALVGRGPGSRIARPLLALVVVFPILLGWARLRAEQHGLLGLEYAVALMVLGTVLVSTFAIFLFAGRINTYDERRRRDLQRRLFLSEASDTLGRSVDLRATLSSVANLCVPALADWCVITLATDGALETVAVVHTDPAKVQWALEYQRRFPPDPNAPTGAGAVARTGRMEFYREIPDELLDAAVRDPEQRRIIAALGMRSSMALPMIASGKTVGVLMLVTAESGRLFDEDDVVVGQELAERCAVAIDRSRLFENLECELEARRRAEDSLRALTAELERRVAQRTAELAVTNRELESFAYSVSHDLRTPLRALDGFSQALLEDYADRLDDAGKECLRRIRRGSQRMGDLIDALLELSRVSRGDLQREPVNLTAIATEILESLSESSQERSVRWRIEPALTATGDPRLLRALLQNLLANAWKFTGTRADATIEFGRQDGSERGRVFVVRDNGAGFDMAYASKLFGAFQRLHADTEFEGTGVGLATAQRIVHRHAGEIWAEAAPDRGAAFFFTLG